MFLSRHSALYNSVTLKSGLGVFQGHWNWHHSIYEFLLAFRGRALFHLRDDAIYWLKIVIFFIPQLRLIDASIGAVPVRLLSRFGTEKLEWCGYLTVKKFEYI